MTVPCVQDKAIDMVANSVIRLEDKLDKLDAKMDKKFDAVNSRLDGHDRWKFKVVGGSFILSILGMGAWQLFIAILK